jgi:hypothetical protein
MTVSSQRLFFRGAELTEDQASMADIKLMTNSTIYLKEAGIEVDDDEEEEIETEFGFSGTKLHLSSRVRLEPRSELKVTDELEPETKSPTFMQQEDAERPKEQEMRMDVMLKDPENLPTVNGQPETLGSPMAVDTSVLSKAPTPILETDNACPTCTFINEREADTCEMCETLLVVP